VLIAGGGVAGLEALLALRALAGDRVDITVVAPELKFFNRSMSVDEPFKPKRGRGIRLEDVLAEFDARWVRADLDRVKHERRVAVTRDGERLSGRALWWPPNKLAGRYLAPYLSSQVGEAADVMPQDAHGIPVETELEPGAPNELPVLADLSPPRPS
jgi:hypothetical protein